MAAARLPKAAANWEVLRKPLTKKTRPTPIVRERLRAAPVSTWNGLVGHALLSQARRVDSTGVPLVILPGTTGLAVISLPADGSIGATGARYENSVHGRLAGYARYCANASEDDSTCLDPDEGHLDVFQLVPDGIEQVTIADQKLTVVDNIAAGTIAPYSRYPDVDASFTRNVRKWTKDAKSKRHAKHAR